MKFSNFFSASLIGLFVMSSISNAVPCNKCNIPAAKNAGVPVNKHVYVYFRDMANIIKQLASAQSSANVQGPPDFSKAEQGLFALGKTIDQASQVLKVYQGTLDDNNANHINKYLSWSARDVVKITAMIKYAKPYSDKQGYTNVIVHILQGITSQISILFQQLEYHMPPASYASSGYSISVFTCSMADAIEYLQPDACTVQGKQFCANLSKQSAGGSGSSQYRDKACNVVKVPSSFTQCGNSATAMYQYGYTNKCLGSTTGKKKWCSGKTTSKRIRHQVIVTAPAPAPALLLLRLLLGAQPSLLNLNPNPNQTILTLPHLPISLLPINGFAPHPDGESSIVSFRQIIHFDNFQSFSHPLSVHESF